MSAVRNSQQSLLPSIKEEPPSQKPKDEVKKIVHVVNPYLLQWAANDGKVKRNLPVNKPIWASQ